VDEFDRIRDGKIDKLDLEIQKQKAQKYCFEDVNELLNEHEFSVSRLLEEDNENE
jgi:hypothetical protein